MSLMNRFIDTLNDAIDKTGAKTLLLGVSGGVDSMAMMAMAAAAHREGVLHGNIGLRVLHFEHGIRGELSLADADHVRACAEALGLSFHTGSAASGALMRSKESVEAAARHARYAFFARIAGAVPDALLVLAHHLEDQTETVMLHLLRGSGGEGLVGMRPLTFRQDLSLWIARPLLEVHKAQLIDYCTSKGLSWREDQTNADNGYRRNCLRNEILPRLRADINPNLDEALMRMSRVLMDEDDYLEIETASLLTRALGAVRSPNADRLGAIGLGGAVIQALHPAMARRVLRRFLRECLGWHEGITLSTVESIRALFGGTNGKKQLIYGMMFLYDFGDVLAVPATGFWGTQPLPERVSLQQDEVKWVSWPEPNGEFEIRDIDPSEVSSAMLSDRSRCFFDGNAVETLIFRTYREGDVFRRFGGGTKPLRRLFNEWHLSEMLRTCWPVVEADGEILWVPEMGRSAVAKFSGGRHTKAILWRRK